MCVFLGKVHYGNKNFIDWIMWPRSVLKKRKTKNTDLFSILQLFFLRRKLRKISLLEKLWNKMKICPYDVWVLFLITFHFSMYHNAEKIPRNISLKCWSFFIYYSENILNLQSVLAKVFSQILIIKVQQRLLHLSNYFCRRND